MSLPSIEELIPHRQPMRLVEEVVGPVQRVVEGKSVEGFACIGRVPEALAQEGHGGVILGIEMGAQTAAVMEALARRDEDDADVAPKMGYLVGLAGATFEVSMLPAGRPLWVEARPAGGMHPLARYDITVRRARDEAPIVSATISTYLVE